MGTESCVVGIENVG